MAILAIDTVWPAPKVATIEPSTLMLMLSILPAAAPFWTFDAVADGDAKPVSCTTSLSSTMSHVMLAEVAPLAQAGASNVTSVTAGAVPPPSAGEAGVKSATWPSPSNVNEPAAIDTGTSDDGATSSPGTVMSQSQPPAVLVNVMVTTCDSPSESKICIGVSKVSPTVAPESRFDCSWKRVV